MFRQLTISNALADHDTRLAFTSGPVNGKKMVVQVVNTGNDLDNNQFDLAIPGGGQGGLQGLVQRVVYLDKALTIM
jgi:CobQ-like glutamine amidotransferase family enzyme